MPNPFLGGTNLEMYDTARIYFHPLVVRRLAAFFEQRTVQDALDVGCGTGHSTQALAQMVKSVIGIDSSVAMLSQAKGRSGIPYVLGLAEQLPFGASSFDLLTVGMALHWFERAAFFREAHRVLRQPGWIAVYDSGFCQRMKENDAFHAWGDEFRARFPFPPRNRAPLTPEFLAETGFREEFFEMLVHTHILTLDQLVAHLSTLSNVLAALNDRRDTPESAFEWLHDTLAPLFNGPAGTFEFDGWIHLLARAE